MDAYVWAVCGGLIKSARTCWQLKGAVGPWLELACSLLVGGMLFGGWLSIMIVRTTQ